MNCTRLVDRVGNQGLSATKIREHARCRAQACRFSHFIMVFALHHEQEEALDIFWMAFLNKKFGFGLGFGLGKTLKTGPIGPVWSNLWYQTGSSGSGPDPGRIEPTIRIRAG